MKTLKVMKAQSLDETEVEDFTIIISKSVPKSNDIKIIKKCFRLEGKKFVKILIESMPQGLTDAILYELLQEKASILRIATH